MHAGIVMLILFYLLGVAPSVSAIFHIIGLYGGVRGSDVVLSVLGGLVWPVLVIVAIVWVLCQSVNGKEGAV